MASYLLLRDNKQKGPYSTQELISLGLKAYDLVWLEGRSAAWRYPSEIEELKPYAPVVEEQPFDRFFKKTETEENDITHSQKKAEQNASITIAPSETATSREKKIYVSLPGSRTGKTQIEQKPAAKLESVKLSQEPNPEQEQPVRLEKKFSQPLDDIKEMYIQNLVDRKKKRTRNKSLVNALKKGSVTFYVLALGILIGFTVKNISFGKGILASRSTTSPQVKKQDPATDQSVSSKNGQTPVTSNKNNTEALKNAEPVNSEYSLPEDATTGDEVNNLHVKDNAVLGSQKKLEKKTSEQYSVSKGPSDDNSILKEETPEDVTTRPINGERQKIVRTATDKNVPGNNNNSSSNLTEANIRRLVTVKGNDYKRGTFGGIFDLQLTVKNDTRYILDEVVVELQYLKPSEQPLKKETIHFNSISPYGTSTINIPPSPRGIKVSYHITNIKYKVGNIDTADL